jgi:hypothetical protein
MIWAYNWWRIEEKKKKDLALRYMVLALRSLKETV